jgi:hypothetical protein
VVEQPPHSIPKAWSDQNIGWMRTGRELRHSGIVIPDVGRFERRQNLSRQHDRKSRCIRLPAHLPPFPSASPLLFPSPPLASNELVFPRRSSPRCGARAGMMWAMFGGVMMSLPGHRFSGGGEASAEGRGERSP